MKVMPLLYSLFMRCPVLQHGVLLIVVMPLLAGCGSQMEGLKPQGGAVSERNFIAPTNFIQQIAATDSITVSNRFSGDYPTTTNENLSLRLTHNQVIRVLKAVSSLRTYPNEANSASLWDLQLQFFHGTNFLGWANFQGSSIVIYKEYRDRTYATNWWPQPGPPSFVIDREYLDRTGILDKLYDEDSDKLLPSFLKKNMRADDKRLLPRESEVISVARSYLKQRFQRLVDGYYTIEEKTNGYAVIVKFPVGYEDGHPIFSPGSGAIVELRKDLTVLRYLPGE